MADGFVGVRRQKQKEPDGVRDPLGLPSLVEPTSLVADDAPQASCNYKS
jgi:hypothetical protein